MFPRVPYFHGDFARTSCSTLATMNTKERANDFLIGLIDSIANVNIDVSYKLLFGIKNTFQCIKIQKTTIQNEPKILLCDGIVHVDEDNLEITPIFFAEESEQKDRRLVCVTHHMFSFNVVYMKRSSVSPLLEFDRDPVIRFFIRFCNKTHLISLDDYIVVKDSTSHSMALSFRQLRTERTNVRAHRHHRGIGGKIRRSVESNTDGLPESPPTSTTCCLFDSFHSKESERIHERND